MSKKQYAYLHTINEEPAEYQDGEQIVTTTPRRPLRLAASLQQIRREQKASRRWRRQQGFPVDGVRYGYRRVEVLTNERSKGKKPAR